MSLSVSYTHLERAYPSVQPIPKQKEKSKVFADGCSFYKIVLLFIIGAFLGDIVETIFCRITAGVWMSRSSLVWGPFSIVWGLAIALATWLDVYKRQACRKATRLVSSESTEPENPRCCAW